MSLIRKVLEIGLIAGTVFSANAQAQLKVEDINSYLTALDSGYKYTDDKDAKLPAFFLEQRESLTLFDTLTHNHKRTELDSNNKIQEIVYPHSWLEFSRIKSNGKTMDIIIVGEYKGKNYPNPSYIIFYDKKQGIQVYDFGWEFNKNWDEKHFREILRMREEELENINR